MGWRSREFTALFPHLLKEIFRPFQTFIERFLRWQNDCVWNATRKTDR
jgi:hypothetical protein